MHLMSDDKEPQQIANHNDQAAATAQYLLQMARSGVTSPATTMPPPPLPRNTSQQEALETVEDLPEEDSDTESRVSRLDEFPYTCYCGEKFSTEQDYSEHTEHQKCIKWDTIMFRDDRVICACGEEFTEPLGLDIHLKLRECINLFPKGDGGNR